jgi:2-dehydro-3-deoxyphosphogluconate aldolase/(4S)-4-hydroxy-2-oxoglutarate aldolase
MEREQELIQKIKEAGFLPLFYHDDTDVCLAVAEALYNGGVRCIEFTNRGNNALANFKSLVTARNENMNDLLLAVGTIKTGNEAQQFIDAGADFLISPVFDSSVCDTAYLNKTLWIPGCTTPTEVHVAEKAGCRMIKLFPGNILGPGFVEAIQPLFRGLDFLVTGGVDTTKENIETWFKAGVAGVGLGSKLISQQLMQEKNYTSIESAARKLVEIIASIKK